MKFFTPEACDTFDEIEPFRKVYGDYRKHLEELRYTLPEHVLRLAEPSGLENALVVQVEHDRERRVLRLILRCGHLQMGYSNLVLIYENAEIRSEHDAVLARIARSTRSQKSFECNLTYHEVDMTEGGAIVHRLIFSSFDPYTGENGWRWFAVRCRALRWRREARRTRRLPPSHDRYPGGPADEIDPASDGCGSSASSVT